jgi:hypothetical protein
VHESDAQGVANAVDIDPQQVRRVAKTGVLDKFGLYRPLLNNPKAPEDWHIEHVGGPRGGRSVGGSPIRITPAESQIQAQIEKEKSLPSSNVLANSFKSVFGVNTQKPVIIANAGVPIESPENNYLNQVNAALSSKPEPTTLDKVDNTLLTAIIQGINQRKEQQMAGLRLLNWRD